MNRIFLMCLFTLFLAGNSYAQKDDKKESYKSLKSRSSIASIEHLLSEADKLKIANPTQALANVQEALGMSLAQKDVLNESKCYLLLGEINEGISEWNLALNNYEKAYQKLSNNYSKTTEYKNTLRGLSAMYVKLGNHQQALYYIQETLKLPLSNTETAERQLDISEVYYQMGNYTEALKAVEGIKINSKVRNESLEGKIQNQKAKIYARTNEVDRANDFYQSSQRNLRAAGNAAPKKEAEQALQDTKEEISSSLREQKRYDDDITLRNQSIDFNLESNNLSGVSKDKIELSKSLAAKGETSNAIRELEEAAIIADTINNPKEQANAYLNLADLYEKNNQPDKAISTYKKFSTAVAQSEIQNQTLQEERAQLIKKQSEIEEQSSLIAMGQQQEQTTLQRQRLLIYGLLLIIVIVVVTSYFIFKNAQESKRANQLLALKSLRGQMNPHFIFNALNSVNQFISQNDERAANKFLSEFSRLMRLVLENSQEDFISLQKEEEIISLYVKLEHYRFRDKFDYTISIDDDINKENMELPPMLIQPYIENAVWHGLRYKEGKGQLDIHIGKSSQGLKVEITDNGIGRKKSTELKTENQKKHNSTGLKNIEERLLILNTVYKTNYQVQVKDLPLDSGTSVTIRIPIKNEVE
ncbi:MAG: histidine kinase [Cyclobacteriaceae bacterium]|nr:histidine kinase [Cyclobacteriaceae bacterium]